MTSLSPKWMIVLLLFANADAQTDTDKTEPLYWFWSAQCDALQLRVGISVDNAQNFSWAVPLCHGTWEQRELAGDSIRIEKVLTISRSVTWSGYRDEAQVTPAGDKIEVNIWVAGAQTEGTIIGLTFTSESLRSIVMNTTFYASPDAESSIELAPGFIFRTAPTGRRSGVDPNESLPRMYDPQQQCVECDRQNMNGLSLASDP